MSFQRPLLGKHILITAKFDHDYIEYLSAAGAKVSHTMAVFGIMAKLEKQRFDIVVITEPSTFNDLSVGRVIKKIRGLTPNSSQKLSPAARAVPIVAVSNAVTGVTPIRSRKVDNLHVIRPNPSGDEIVEVLTQVAKAPRMTAAEVAAITKSSGADELAALLYKGAAGNQARSATITR